jgi:hypothetical protein
MEDAVMKRNLLIAIAAGFVWSVVGVGSAQAQLSRSEQLFLWLNYYQNQRNTQAIRNEQAKQQFALDRLGQQQAAIARNTAPVEPAFNRYLAPGRSSPQVQPMRTPPIYSGQGGQRQYFLQQGRYFNPPR